MRPNQLDAKPRHTVQYTPSLLIVDNDKKVPQCPASTNSKLKNMATVFTCTPSIHDIVHVQPFTQAFQFHSLPVICYDFDWETPFLLEESLRVDAMGVPYSAAY